MKAVAHPAFAVAYPQRCDLVRKRSERVLGIAPESRTNRREPNWGEFADQVIPELPLSQTSDGNYVASEVVPCVFLAAPHPQRHITPSATESYVADHIRFHRSAKHCSSASPTTCIASGVPQIQRKSTKLP